MRRTRVRSLGAAAASVMSLSKKVEDTIYQLLALNKGPGMIYILEPRLDYALLISTYTEQHRHRGWPRQRLLHECLRAPIRNGTLAAGTRLVATRALAAQMGVARNTVLYAYEQLASEGFVT